LVLAAGGEIKKDFIVCEEMPLVMRAEGSI
jgi:hypothetical protein